MKQQLPADPDGAVNVTMAMRRLAPLALKTLMSVVVVLAVGFWAAGGDLTSSVFGVAVLVALLILGIVLHHVQSELMSWWVRYLNTKQSK